MANTITAGNGTNNGLAVASDATGALNILTGSGAGTAAISIDSSQNVTMAADAAVTGDLAVTGNTTITGTLSATGGVTGSIASATAVTASGTSIDFTSIPAGVKRITVMFSGVSTSGTSSVIVQLGAGSVETTGYLGSGANGSNSAVAFTIGIPSVISLPAANAFYGTTTIVTTGSNAWVGNSTIGSSATGNPQYGGGGKTIGGTLDRVRITTVNGTDTFDAGTINIIYE